MSDTDFASYADDNIHYVSTDNIDEVIRKPRIDFIKSSKWF